MKGKRGREITIPDRNRKVSIVMANSTADRLKEIMRGVRDAGGPIWSGSAIIHQLVADAEVTKTVKRLSTIEALSGGRK